MELQSGTACVFWTGYKQHESPRLAGPYTRAAVSALPCKYSPTTSVPVITMTATLTARLPLALPVHDG